MFIAYVEIIVISKVKLAYSSTIVEVEITSNFVQYLDCCCFLVRKNEKHEGRYCAIFCILTSLID